MDKIFLEIFNTSLTAGGIVLAVLVLRLLLKKAPRAYTCALWGIVGLRLVWPFSIESGLSLIPSPEVIPQSQLYDATPQVQTGIPSLNSAVNPVFSQTFAPEVGASVNPLQVVLSVAGWVWVIGMAAMVIYSLVSYLRLRRQVCAAVRQEGNVYLCDDVASPFILGIFRPKIYLPSDMPQEQIACVLAHERAHLKRKDHWLKPLGFALLTVHWFHPLLWLAYILLCRDIEFACDEKVIADMDAEEKAHYSETLLSCSISRKQVSACPLAFGETGVKGRIQSVLNYKKPAFWLIMVALIVCIVVAVVFVTDPLTGNMEAGELVCLQMISQQDDGSIYAQNEKGVCYQVLWDGADRMYNGEFFWIVTAEKTKPIYERLEDGTLVRYQVEAETLYYQYSQKDENGEYICSSIDWDIDGDGVIEQCRVYPGPTSGIQTYDLRVYQGDILECNNPWFLWSREAPLLYVLDGQLRLIGVRRTVRHDAGTEDLWTVFSYELGVRDGEFTFDGYTEEELSRKQLEEYIRENNLTLPDEWDSEDCPK